MTFQTDRPPTQTFDHRRKFRKFRRVAPFLVAIAAAVALGVPMMTTDALTDSQQATVALTADQIGATLNDVATPRDTAQMCVFAAGTDATDASPAIVQTLTAEQTRRTMDLDAVADATRGSPETGSSTMTVAMVTRSTFPEMTDGAPAAVGTVALVDESASAETTTSAFVVEIAQCAAGIVESTTARAESTQEITVQGVYSEQHGIVTMTTQIAVQPAEQAEVVETSAEVVGTIVAMTMETAGQSAERQVEIAAITAQHGIEQMAAAEFPGQYCGEAIAMAADSGQCDVQRIEADAFSRHPQVALAVTQHRSAAVATMAASVDAHPRA